MDKDTKMVPNSRNGIGTRLEVVINKLGGVPHLAKTTDLSTSTLRRYINEETDVKLSDAVSLCRMAGISLSWLAEGVGDQEAQADSVRVIKKIRPRIHFLAERQINDIQEKLRLAGEDLYNNPNKYNELREQLRELVQPGELLEDQRAQALLMLEIAFNDEYAKAERKVIEQQLVVTLRKINSQLERAESAAGFQLPSAVKENLKSLLLAREPSLIDLIKLLEAMRESCPKKS